MSVCMLVQTMAVVIQRLDVVGSAAQLLAPEIMWFGDLPGVGHKSTFQIAITGVVSPSSYFSTHSALQLVRLEGLPPAWTRRRKCLGQGGWISR